MNTEKYVHLEGVVATISQFPVLSGVSVSVNSSEIVLLRGPNGAGKTSVLRLCAGLIPPLRGTAQVLGKDLYKDRTSFRPEIGFVGHYTGLYDDLTAEENIKFFAKIYRSTNNNPQSVSDQLGLSKRLLKTKVAHLSAGQRRRVSIAPLFLRSPKLWLLDEPHAGLDSDTRDVLDSLLIQQAQSGSAVLFASHEHERAQALTHRTVDISGGMNKVLEPANAF